MFLYLIIIPLFSSLIGQDKGIESFRKRDYDEAKHYYESILDKDSDNIKAKFGLATTLYEQDEKETASSYFQSILNIADKKLASKASFNYANLLREEGKVDESIEYYKKAILLDKNNEDAKINNEILKNTMNQDQQNQDQQNQDQQNQDQQNQADKIQSRAILDALKQRDRINQKRHIKAFKSKTFEKDW